VLYFLTTGSIWAGAEPPEISSDALAPLVAEITAMTDRSDVEEAVGEPWEVRLPTSLVALRDGPGLPSWTRNDAGGWLSR
jgi:hypothetical protein